MGLDQGLGLEALPGHCVVFLDTLDTLLSHCLFPARSIHGYWKIAKESFRCTGVVTCDGPRGVDKL